MVEIATFYSNRSCFQEIQLYHRSLRQKINTQNNRVISIELDSGEIIEGDNYIFAGDPETCYRELLDQRSFFKSLLPEKKYSMGLYVLYFGTKKTLIF